VNPITGSADWGRISDVCLLDEFCGHGLDKDKNGIDDDYERHGRGAKILLSDAHVKFVKAYTWSTGVVD